MEIKRRKFCADPDEFGGRGGVSEGISEGLPMLREHAAIRVSDFDTVV